MDPASLVGLAIAAIVGGIVAWDASTLRHDEIAVLGTSRVMPVLWGLGVFLLLIVFLPWYLIMRTTHRRRLLAAQPTPAQTPPPFPPTQVVVPPGWHPDPTGRHESRYWDGNQWTTHVSDNGVESTDTEA